MTETIKRHKNLLPIILLAGLCLWTVYEVLFTKFEYEGVLYDRSFSRANILGFIAVMMNIGVYCFGRKYFKNAVLITLGLGLLGTLNFTSSTYVITFIFPFHAVSVLIGILYLAINFKRVKNRLDRPHESNLELLPDPKKIEEFKNKYLQKTNEELEEISNDKRFVVEAKIASTEILDERNKKAQQLT